MKKRLILTLCIIILILLGVMIFEKSHKQTSIKIGLITDLSGPASYFGEKSLLGAEIVKNEFAKKGIEIEIITEDYQLQAGKAATAAQKLLNVDSVDFIYVDFTPGAVAVSSVVENKDIPFVYTAAIESPLIQVDSAFKTYLDYRAGCRKIAQSFKDRGVEKIGILEVSTEYGFLCKEGVKEVYGDMTVAEGYTLGDTDFRTQIAKLKDQKVQAIINVGFEGDTYNTLKNMRELGLDVPYGTVADTLTEKVMNNFKEELKGGLAFGYDEIDSSFKQKIEEFTGETLESAGPEYVATALVYTHLTQGIEATIKCKDDNKCFVEEVNKKTNPKILGFEKFENRVAVNSFKLFEF